MTYRPTDPDILRIRRRRLQDRRCAACGADVRPARRGGSWPALCEPCGLSLRWCPTCERVYGRADASHPSNARKRSDICRPCAVKAVRPTATPRAAWRAALAERRRRIVRMARRGRTNDQIAAALGTTPRAIEITLRRERKRVSV